ncbi:MAG: DUF1648 domain-containing protein [Sedimentisphaerales bacterium]
MHVTKTELACIGIFFVLCGVSAYFYPQIPERMACHWDLHGQVNGYMPKSINLLICPFILAILIAVLTTVPRVASVAANIDGFRKFYGGLVLFFSVFLLAIQYQMILWGLGIKINPLWVILAVIFISMDWIILWYFVTRRQN